MVHCDPVSCTSSSDKEMGAQHYLTLWPRQL